MKCIIDIFNNIKWFITSLFTTFILMKFLFGFFEFEITSHGVQLKLIASIDPNLEMAS